MEKPKMTKPVLHSALKEDEALYIDLNAFVKDISEGDGEWFERIAERELQKLEITRSNRA